MGTERVKRPNYGPSDPGLSPMALKLGPEPLYSTRSPREVVSTPKARIELWATQPKVGQTNHRPNQSLVHPHAEETHSGVIPLVG